MKTIFRKFKDGSIIALFPYDFYNRFDVDSITSYMHVGQHGEADYSHILTITKLATEEEYKDLLLELEDIGYEIEPIEKRHLSRALKFIKEIANKEFAEY